MTPETLTAWGTAIIGIIVLAWNSYLTAKSNAHGTAVALAKQTGETNAAQIATLTDQSFKTALATVPVSVSPTQPATPAQPPMPFTPKLPQ